MDSKSALVTLARFAQGQWGMVTSAQAMSAKVNYMQLKRMTEAGLLDKVGPGVYLLIGGQAALGRHRAHKVAWLRLDPGVAAWERPLLDENYGVVSHRSAAAVLRLGNLVVPDVEFTTARRRTSRDRGVRMHQATLAPYEVTWEDGLPVTTAVRTLADLLDSGLGAASAGSFLAEALDRRMLNVEHAINEIAPFAARYGCVAGDGAMLVERLLDSAAAGLDALQRERTIGDLSRELMQLSPDQLQTLRSLASAAREPSLAALLSRVASGRSADRT